MSEHSINPPKIKSPLKKRSTDAFQLEPHPEPDQDVLAFDSSESSGGKIKSPPKLNLKAVDAAVRRDSHRKIVNLNGSQRSSAVAR